MSVDTELRQRTNAKGPKSIDEPNAKSPEPKTTESTFGVVDLLRAFVGLFLVSTLGSYLLTRGESYVWGFEKSLPGFVRQYAPNAKAKPQSKVSGFLELTNEELAAYDGNSPDKPILLALNRTIYDVSTSPQVYGPGGMYSQLAAKDASRSYITTCFDPKDDLVPYFGGVEEIYVPLWLSKKPPQDELDEIAKGEVMEGVGMQGIIDTITKKLGIKRTRLMRQEAYAVARERVRAQVKQWESMFEKKEYPVVGKVIGVDEEDSKKWKGLKFCDAAKNQRPPIGESLAEAMKQISERKDGTINIGDMKRSPGKKGLRGDIPVAERPQEKSKSASEAPSAKGGKPLGSKNQDDKAKAALDDMMSGGKYGGSGDVESEKEGVKEAIEQVEPEILEHSDL